MYFTISFLSIPLLYCIYLDYFVAQKAPNSPNNRSNFYHLTNSHSFSTALHIFTFHFRYHRIVSFHFSFSISSHLFTFCIASPQCSSLFTLFFFKAVPQDIAQPEKRANGGGTNWSCLGISARNLFRLESCASLDPLVVVYAQRNGSDFRIAGKTEVCR